MTSRIVVTGLLLTFLLAIFATIFVGSGARLNLKLLYGFTVAISLVGSFVAFYNARGLRAFCFALLSALAGAILFDAGTASFIVKRDFLDSWYVLYPVWIVVIMALTWLIIAGVRVVERIAGESH